MKITTREEFFTEKMSIQFVYTELNESTSELTQEQIELQQRVRFSLGKASNTYPFFTDFALKLKIVFTDRVKTMATDGFRIFVSYKWSSKLSTKEQVFVLCHEILHVVFLHFMRREKHNIPADDYELKVWNEAADYEINPVLIEDGVLSQSEFDKLGGLHNPEFKGLPAEVIYDILMDYYEKNKKNPKSNKSDKSEEKGEENKSEKNDKSGDDDSDLGSEVAKELADATGGSTNEPTSKGKSSKGKESKGNSEDEDDDSNGNENSTKTWKNSAGDEKTSDELCKGINPNGPGEYGSKTGALDENLTPEEGDKLDPDGKQGRVKGSSGETEKDEEGREIKQKDSTNEIDRINDIKETVSKNAGKGGAGLSRAIAGFYKSSVDWKKELKRYVGKALSANAVLKSIGRRGLSRGEYSSGFKRDEQEMDFMCAFIDTSGSMGDKAIKQCISEFREIVKLKKPREAAIFYFDDGIQSVDWIKKSKMHPEDFKPLGGGGTAFKPCLKYLEHNFIRKGRAVSLVLFMTDGFNFDNGPAGYIDIPKPTYSDKFIWVITDGNGAGAQVKTRWGHRVNLPPEGKE